DTRPWRALESIPELTATAAIWRAQLGDYFETFRQFLQSVPRAFASSGEAEAAEDSPLWQIDRVSLGRALCDAFGLERKRVDFPLPATGQIGSWSADAVP